VPGVASTIWNKFLQQEEKKKEQEEEWKAKYPSKASASYIVESRMPL
jgi:hypothetical protein